MAPKKRQGEAPPRPVVGDPTDPQGMVVLLNQFLDWPRARNYAERTVECRQAYLAEFNQPNVTEPLGVRDRSILEVLYSTGMRRVELTALQLYDVDADRGTVMIRQGKGKKDRMVPIGQRALSWIGKYSGRCRTC